MDKKKLEALYQQKVRELDDQRKKLGEMYVERVSAQQPLTDEDMLRQNESCGNVCLEVERLKEMLEGFED